MHNLLQNAQDALADEKEPRIVVETAARGDTVRFDVGRVTIEPFELEPSGDDIIEHDLTLQALRPDPVEPIATVEIVNSRIAVA